MKKILILLLLIFILTSKTCYGLNVNPEDQHNFDKRIATKNRIFRKTVDKRYLKLLNHEYKYFKIFNYCRIGFTHKNHDEFAIQIINTKTKEMKYVLLLNPMEYYKTIELSSYTLENENTTNWIEEIPDLLCFTKNALKKEIKDIDSTTDVIRDESLHPINKFDTVCAGSDFYDYLCYAYSLSRNSIVALGGWLTH
ncbi:MAG TPA: hypothetical protein VHE99_08325 [Gammaproteobacteria bacterium]|nr:hypothetical protein [Gammaproteobacteria bacterium]